MNIVKGAKSQIKKIYIERNKASAILFFRPASKCYYFLVCEKLFSVKYLLLMCFLVEYPN